MWLSYYDNTSDEELKLAHKKVCEKFNKNIDFLIIEHDENMQIGDLRKSIVSSSITRYNLYGRSYDEKGNLTSIGRAEDCIKILDSYALIPPFRQRVKNFIGAIKRFTIKLFIALTPLRSTRKKLRKRFL